MRRRPGHPAAYRRLAAAWALARGASAAAEGGIPDVLESALREDSECASAGSPCAANMVQMRGRRVSSSPDLEPLVVEVPRQFGNVSSSDECDNDTGGSCRAFLCKSSRGPTDCENGRCLCQEGFCAKGGRCEAPVSRGTCSRNTGGSCKILRCDATRGPAQCIDGACRCVEGLCASSGKCALAESVFTAEVAPVDAENPDFPGAHAEVDTALCFSGGGSRSLSLVLGALRALEGQGLMEGVDAISSVSGGTWAAGIYMFAEMVRDKLLGVDTNPSELTVEELKKKPPALGAAAMADTEAIAMRLISEGTSPDRLWEQTVSEAFLKPFGLSDRVAFMAPGAEAARRIIAENPQLESARFVVPQPGRPKVFVMNGAVLAPIGYLASNSNVVSLQMSPDFSGTPFHPDRAGVTYKAADLDEAGPLNNYPVGGGLVETFAFGGAAPIHGQNGSTRAALRSPSLPFSLTEAMGISSAAFAGKVAGKKFGPAAVVPKSSIWPVWRPVAARQYSLGDGGNVENGGVLAMMQRRAKRIAWWINTDTGISRDFDFCTESLEGADVAKLMTNQLYDKFGYGKLASEYYSHNQVFKQEDMKIVLCDLQTAIKAGKPAVSRHRLEVQANEWWGILPYTVDIAFVYNENCSDFVELLPEDTREAISKGSKGEFAHFPFFKTMFNNGPLKATSLSAAQINLAAAQSEYFVRRNAELFHDLLGPKPATVEVPVG